MRTVRQLWLWLVFAGLVSATACQNRQSNGQSSSRLPVTAAAASEEVPVSGQLGRMQSFSTENAKWYQNGDDELKPKRRLNWRKNREMYTVIADKISIDQRGIVTVNWQEGQKLPFDVIRISAEWPELEPDDLKGRSGLGRFDFSELDENIAFFQSRGARVMSNIGLKTLWWPEHKFPDHYNPGGPRNREREIAKGSRAGQALLALHTAVVQRYANGFVDTARGIKITPIRLFQPENEAFEFTGDDPRTAISQELMAAIVAIYRKEAPKSEVWLTMGSGLTDQDLLSPPVTKRWESRADRLSLPRPDGIGINTYYQGYAEADWEFRTNWPKWQHVRTALVDRIQKKGIRVANVEWQAMPWEFNPALMNLYDPNGNRSLSPDDLETVAAWVDAMEIEGGGPFGMEFANACLANGNSDWRIAIDKAMARPQPKVRIVH